MYNKKFACLTILPIVLIIATFTDSFSQSKFQAGPYVGNGVRMLTGNDKADFGFGYHAGIITRIPFTENFSVTPTFTYARKGYNEIGFTIIEEDEYYKQRTSYFDIYVPVKYQFGGIFTFQVGVQAGILLNGELRYKDNYSERQKIDVTDKLNPVDWGIVAGAGCQFMNGIGLEFILNPGFSNIYKDDPPLYYQVYSGETFGTEFDGKNLLATINIYYLFGYTKKDK